MKYRRFVLVCMCYVYFDVFLSTKITGNSHTGTCTNPHLRIDHVDHQHYPMVVTHGVLANHVKVKDTFSLSQSEPLIKGFEQLAGECEIRMFRALQLNNFSNMHYTYINIRIIICTDGTYILFTYVHVYLPA